MTHRDEFGINRFGISEEELEFDENDPSWIDLRMLPGSNVLDGSYQSAKGFVERAQRQQRAYLEKKVAEREALRQLIRDKVSREFDEKLALHMAKFQPKKYDSPTLESHLAPMKQESNEGCKENHCLREPEPVHYPLSTADNVNSHLFETESVKSMEMISTIPEPMQPSEAAVTLFTVPESAPSTPIIVVSPPNSTSPSFPVSPSSTESKTSTIFIDSFDSTKATTSTPVELSPIQMTSTSLPFDASKIALHCDCELCSAHSQSQQKTSTHLTDTSNIMTDVSKTGHATLTRTDSVPLCSSSTSRSTTTTVTMKKSVLHAISNVHDTNEVNTTDAVETDTPSVVPFFEIDDQSQSNNEEQPSSIKDSAAEMCSSPPFEQSLITGTLTHLHPIYEQEIAFTKDFITKTAKIPNHIKNELKRTIKEKISISTKKLATPNDIAQIVCFFKNLLSGVTIYGFNDKMINLKDDELARNWAMVHIIDTYLNLVPQDLSLLHVITEVLSTLASSSVTFSKLLHGKFFVASPLLALNHFECMQHILDLKKRSERYAEALSAWNSREIATIRLFLALKMLNSNEKHQTAQTPSGLGLLWKLIVVSINDIHTAFGAVLVAEILKEYWEPLHVSYGKQMEKLVALIDRSFLPYWKLPPQKIMLADTEANETLVAVVEKYLTTLKFTVDDCLASLRSS